MTKGWIDSTTPMFEAAGTVWSLTRQNFTAYYIDLVKSRKNHEIKQESKFGWLKGHTSASKYIAQEDYVWIGAKSVTNICDCKDKMFCTIEFVKGPNSESSTCMKTSNVVTNQTQTLRGTFQFGRIRAGNATIKYRYSYHGPSARKLWFNQVFLGKRSKAVGVNLINRDGNYIKNNLRALNDTGIEEGLYGYTVY